MSKEHDTNEIPCPHQDPQTWECRLVSPQANCEHMKSHTFVHRPMLSWRDRFNHDTNGIPHCSILCMIDQ